MSQSVASRPPPVALDGTAASPGQLSLQARVGAAAVIAVGLLTVFWPASDAPDAPPGMLIDGGGRPVTLASRMGPVTLVHFWATWCPPCLDEVPSLLRLATDFHTQPGFSMVIIAVDDEVDKVQTFLGDAFRSSLFDPDWKVAHRYGTRKLPETHLVVGGQIVESFIGATNWNDPDIRDRLRQALDGVQAS